MKTLKGFTLVELMIVIVVIGVLTTISVLGYNQYQANTRDALRSAKAKAITEALEKYYDQNGEYPGCQALVQSPTTVNSTTLTGVDKDAFTAPMAIYGTNSITCGSISIGGDDLFGFVGDGSATCTSQTTNGSCLGFTFQYKNEVSGTITSIASRHTASLATSGTITLTATTTGVSTITASWTALANTASYTLQSATDEDFTTNVATLTDLTSTSYDYTALNQGTTYYFRVMAISAGGSSDWTDDIAATTYALAKPSLTITPTSSTSVTVSWASIQYAENYTLQYTSNGSDWTGASSINITAPTTSVSVTGLSTGVTYYFRATANKTENSIVYTSSWSTTKNSATVVPAPASSTCTTASSTSISATWATVVGANSYSLEYDSSNTFDTSNTIANISAPPYTITGLTQGKTYYCRVYAYIGTTSSDASPVSSATTTISAPTSVNVNAYVPGATRPYSDGNWVEWTQSTTGGNWYYAYDSATGSCPSGTTLQFRHYANYSSPTTLRGPTGWSTTKKKYMVAPNSPYGIRFKVDARCVGSNATSSSVSDTSGYAYN